jgi:WD40 repeat protein
MKNNLIVSRILAVIMLLSPVACTQGQESVDQPAPTQHPTRPPRPTQAPPQVQPTRQNQPRPTATIQVPPTAGPTVNPSDVVFRMDLGSEGMGFLDGFVDPYGNALIVFLENDQVQVFHLEEGWAATFHLPTEFMFGQKDISVQSSQIIIVQYTINEVGDITLWQVTPGNEAEGIATISETDGWVTDLMFSPDGKTLAVGFNLGEIRLYRTSDGSRLRTIKAFNDFVTSMAYSPDGRYIIADSTSFDSNSYVFNASSGAKTATLSTESWEPGFVSFSPDGKLAAATSQNDGTHIFSTSTWRETGVVIGGVWNGAFTCDSKGFKETMGETTDFYSLTSGNLEQTLVIGPIYCLPDGRSVVVDMDYTNSIITLQAITP